MSEQAIDIPDDGERQPTGGPEYVREAALDAATRLFADRGIHGVSVREIAREVGVSHTLLHLYFGSKEEILRQLFRRGGGRFATAFKMTNSLSDSAVEAFRATNDNPEFIRVLAAALIEGIVPKQISIVPSAHKAFADRADKDCEGVDARVITAAVGSMAIGWALSREWITEHLDLDELGEEEVVDQMSSIIRRIVEDHS